MRAGRIEAPGAVLSAGVATHQVENPMEAFKRSLSALWPLPEMQRQAVAHMLSLTGVQNILNQQLAGRGTDAVTAAMNSQIQDLEAERLALIMQVDAAKKNLSALRREAMEQAGREENEALQRARHETENARAITAKPRAPTWRKSMLNALACWLNATRRLPIFKRQASPVWPPRWAAMQI